MKVLELKFRNADDKIVTLSLDAPVEPVDPALINTVMDTIVAENAFISSGGNLIKKESARIVERQVTDITLG
jgi:hypothetical protein